MISKPTRVTDINTGLLNYSPIKVLDNGSKTVYIGYGPEKLVLQTPVMSIPWGVGDGYRPPNAKDDEFRPRSYDLSLSFRGIESSPKLQQFHTKLKEIEASVIKTIHENRLTWLRDDDIDERTVSKMFTTMIKQDRDKETGRIAARFPDTFRVKLPYDAKSDAFTFECTTMDKDPVDFKQALTKLKGGRAQCLIQLGGLWIAGGRLGVTWRLLRMKVKIPSTSKYEFVSDDEDDDEGARKASDDEDVVADALAASKEVPAITNPPPAPTGPTYMGEEDDEEDEDEDMLTPPPPPKRPAPTSGGGAKKVAKK